MRQPPVEPAASRSHALGRAGRCLKLTVPDQDWELYQGVIDGCQRRGLSFAIGGGLAFSCYSEQQRWTKDLDLFIPECQRDEFIAVAAGVGFGDYHEKKPYDRSWIYRAVRNDVILDLIWEMANHRAKVDERWWTRGREVELHGRVMRAIPAEELIWAKIYILQRDRCDWPDVINVIHAQADALDWQHLIDNLAEDAPLLRGALSVYQWLCPQASERVPRWVLRRLGLTPEPTGGEPRNCDANKARLDLIDSRDWFGPGARGVPMAE